MKMKVNNFVHNIRYEFASLTLARLQIVSKILGYGFVNVCCVPVNLVRFAPTAEH